MPSVSVIVTCCNLGEYLDEAIASVRAQTFQDLELLVVDDGSTAPTTLQALDRFEQAQVPIVRTANRGLPAAKNTGVARTSGRYICMLDADDRLAPDMLARSVAILEDDPGLSFASHWLRYFGDEQGEWTPAACDFPELLDRNTVNGAALVRRSAIEAAGGFDESFRDGCEDWDFWITVVERGGRGVIIPEVLYEYRRREGSMSRVMHQRIGHPALYHRLAAKHAPAFREHLAALVARRERDIAAFMRENHNLQWQHDKWLAPELARWHDEVAVLERRAATQVLEKELRHAQAEVHALRQSWSWRITAVPRLVYGWLLAVSGRQ